jgi:hypothetical protein
MNVPMQADIRVVAFYQLKQMLNWTQQSPIILILPWDVKGNALLT